MSYKQYKGGWHMKYRTKELLEAIQFTGSNEKEISTWLRDCGAVGAINIDKEEPEDNSVACIMINIHGGCGALEVYAGEYLVCIDGWFEVYGQNYFESTYEEA